MGAGRTRFADGPASTKISLTYRRSTSTASSRFSALAIAALSSFSRGFATCLFVRWRMFTASCTSLPRIRSATRRALRGVTRRKRSLAWTSMVSSSSLLLPLGRDLFLLAGMAAEGARGAELAQLVAHHVLAHVHRDELRPVVHGDGVADHVGDDGGAAGPGLDDLLLPGVVERRHLLLQVVVDEEALLE